ncbi:alginate export family protein [Metapseudomonas boanensis]|uniref:Alginate export family protein n=1 Tax=Metapseudomonas boanensis TaxID=2822138 RepID=A0ABS5XPD8_9GAMM|nr:alginate export family protein [Pseudomonas boanensis]MBT8768152.1 alginate export family protein [Pseudomonas boanensis]
MNMKPWMNAGLGLSLLSASIAFAAQNDDKNFGLDVKITAQSEADRDLGTRDGGDVNGLGLDVRPWVYGERGEWSAFAMGQAVTATDIVETDTLESSDIESDSSQRDDGREPDKNYLAMREFWVDYGGLTAYPGEHLRFGRQRVRSEEGTWWDTNIEALRWSFDTTLLKAHVGVAERFSEYRTDIDELAPEDEDRRHLFGDISTQWQPGHWVGLKAHHSRDEGDLPNVGEEVDELSKRTTGDLTWLGINADGGFFDRRSSLPLNYWAEATWLTGDADELEQTAVGDQTIASGSRNVDVNAWALDLGLRWNIDDQWKVGGAYARGSGGGDDDSSEQFRQTGLESNRSAFTGTEARMHRFGEAFRGELSNLQVASAFTSWQMGEDYDASLVYHRFWRVDDNQDVGQSGIIAPLEDGEKDIGQEVDLVVTKYFKQGLLPASMTEHLDERSALVRLRGGVFKPGDAYGAGTDSLMHRAFVDVIWRF